MDRARFEYLLDAYGADFSRWPANERAAAIAFAQDNAQIAGPLLDEAQVLDAKLNLARPQIPPSAALGAQILAAAPSPSSVKRAQKLAPAAGWALAACALLGVFIGYGAGALAAPAADQDEYFAAAFEAPPTSIDLGDPG